MLRPKRCELTWIHQHTPLRKHVFNTFLRNKCKDVTVSHPFLVKIMRTERYRQYQHRPAGRWRRLNQTFASPLPKEEVVAFWWQLLPRHSKWKFSSGYKTALCNSGSGFSALSRSSGVFQLSFGVLQVCLPWQCWRRRPAAQRRGGNSLRPKSEQTTTNADVRMLTPR